MVFPLEMAVWRRFWSEAEDLLHAVEVADLAELTWMEQLKLAARMRRVGP